MEQISFADFGLLGVFMFAIWVMWKFIVANRKDDQKQWASLLERYDKEHKEHRDDMEKWNNKVVASYDKVATSMDKLTSKITVSHENLDGNHQDQTEKFSEFKGDIGRQLEWFKENAKNETRAHTELRSIVTVNKQQLDTLTGDMSQVKKKLLEPKK